MYLLIFSATFTHIICSSVVNFDSLICYNIAAVRVALQYHVHVHVYHIQVQYDCVYMRKGLGNFLRTVKTWQPHGIELGASDFSCQCSTT